jgi:YHS domain-containing protein
VNKYVSNAAYPEEVSTIMKDPVCGVDVSEEKATHLIHSEHETFYFCSERCKTSYARQIGIKKPAAKKGLLVRFLEKLAKDNEKNYGGKPPTCH